MLWMIIATPSDPALGPPKKENDLAYNFSLKRCPCVVPIPEQGLQKMKTKYTSTLRPWQVSMTPLNKMPTKREMKPIRQTTTLFFVVLQKERRWKYTFRGASNTHCGNNFRGLILGDTRRVHNSTPKQWASGVKRRIPGEIILSSSCWGHDNLTLGHEFRRGPIPFFLQCLRSW